MRIILKNADFSANNINTPNIFEFTLQFEGHDIIGTYQFEEGMTWSDWIKSEYNPGLPIDSYYLIGTGNCVMYGGTYNDEGYANGDGQWVKDAEGQNVKTFSAITSQTYYVPYVESETHWDGSVTVSDYDGTIPEMTYVDPATVENAYDGSVEVSGGVTGYTVTVASNYAVTVYDNTTEVGTVSSGGNGSFTITSGTMYVYQADSHPVKTHNETGGVTFEAFTASDTTFNEEVLGGVNDYVTKYTVTGDGSTSITYTTTWD